eukprot:2281240-Rhodomonas_salina.1
MRCLERGPSLSCSRAPRGPVLTWPSALPGRAYNRSRNASPAHPHGYESPLSAARSRVDEMSCADMRDAADSMAPPAPPFINTPTPVSSRVALSVSVSASPAVCPRAAAGRGCVRAVCCCSPLCDTHTAFGTAGATGLGLAA